MRSRFLVASLIELALVAFVACIGYVWLEAGGGPVGPDNESWRSSWDLLVFWLLAAATVAAGGLWAAIRNLRYLVSLAAAGETLLALVVMTGRLTFWPFLIGTGLMVAAAVVASLGPVEERRSPPADRRKRAFAIALTAAVAMVIVLAWGPLLVTSPDEALSTAKDEPAFADHTVGDVVRAYESATNQQGTWRSERNGAYDSFFEGDRGGFRWIVTYDAPGTGDLPELEFWVKRFTGGVMTREPNWSFLPDDQLEEYLDRGVE